MIDLNKNKSMKRQTGEELILREEDEERNVGFLEDPQWSFQVECRGTMPLEGLKRVKNKTRSVSSPM